MKIVFYPPYSESNDYINVIVDSIESAGANIINKNWHGDVNIVIRTLAETLQSKDVIFHFNWLEDNAAVSGFLARIKCGLIILFFCVFHHLGGRIVWTMHNTRSHNNNNKFQEVFIRKMLKYVDRVMVHCSESIQILDEKYSFPKNKALFVPIGNYNSVMNDYLVGSAQRSKDVVKYLYFGAISAYKGVETLIKAYDCEELNQDCFLTICGKPNSEELKTSIERLSEKNNSISLKLRFVSNEELAILLTDCDVVVLPYEKESMQNSSAAIMAFTCGRPVIIPRFGYIKDIENNDFVLSYDYSSEEEKLKNLRCQLIKFKQLHNRDINMIESMSRSAKDFADRQLDWNTISNKIVSLYNTLGENNDRF